MSIEIICTEGHENEYDSAVDVPPRCEDCGAPVEFAGEFESLDSDQMESDKI